MLNLNSLMSTSSQPKVLIEFYTKVFGMEPPMRNGDWAGWQVGNVFFGVGGHSEITGPTKEPARFIWNIETDDVKGEFERVKALGAVVVKEPYEMSGQWICTLQDPDGNMFQFISPWIMGK